MTPAERFLRLHTRLDWRCEDAGRETWEDFWNWCDEQDELLEQRRLRQRAESGEPHEDNLPF